MSATSDLRARWNALIGEACSHQASSACCEVCAWEAAVALCTAAGGTTSPAPGDDETRCAVCAGPLQGRREDGCVRGGCATDPLPGRFYAPKRACQEYQVMITDTGAVHRFYQPIEP